jgi:hypothetical protein
MRMQKQWVMMGLLFLGVGCGGNETTQGEELELASVDQAACTAPACGTALATLDGQTAYSNGANQGTGVACTTPSYNPYYGERYQCVEFARRYWALVKGRNIPTGIGNACNLCGITPSGWEKRSPNQPYAPPTRGDLIVLPCTSSVPTGHVAVVSSVSVSSPTSWSASVVEQNVSCTGRNTYSYSQVSCILHPI